ncbi:MAG: hypothetical protein ABW044_05445 [Cellvibrio sp.]
MKWSDLSKTIGKVAPMLGTALGGPMGGAIGSVISSALGVSNDADAVAIAIKTDPQIAVKLREIESQNEANLREHAFKVLAIEQKEMDSARTMQASALSQDDLFSKRFVYYFASALCLGGATYIALITFMEIPEQNIRFADTALGFVLGSMLAPVVGFFFGTSFGSRNKSNEQATMINKLIDKQ